MTGSVNRITLVYYSIEDFPLTGVYDTVYVIKNSDQRFRWNGKEYVKEVLVCPDPLYFSTRLDFPEVGEVGRLYCSILENQLYVFNISDNEYTLLIEHNDFYTNLSNEKAKEAEDLLNKLFRNIYKPYENIPIDGVSDFVKCIIESAVLKMQAKANNEC